MFWNRNFSERVVWAPIFFGHTKFEVKFFLEFFCLQSTLDAEFFAGGGGWSGHQLFFVMPNLRPKIFLEFFYLQSALD